MSSLCKLIIFDIKKGILNQYIKFIFLAAFVLCTCFAYDGILYSGGMFKSIDIGVSDYILNIFKGVAPYIFDVKNAITFKVPFEWLMIYICLAYCVGNYVKKSITEFGSAMIVKTGSRTKWWIAKSIWVVILNVVFFMTIYATVFAYYWVFKDGLKFMPNVYVLQMWYGNLLSELEIKDIILIIYLMPFLVGIIQSFLQILVELIFDDYVGFIVIAIELIIASYYRFAIMPHEYAMLTRYYNEYEGYKVLNITNGLIYLIVLMVVLYIINIVINKKMNILRKQ